MHSLPSPLGRAKPNLNLHRVVNVVVISRDIGPRVVNLVIPQEIKEITIIEDINISKIILVRVLKKILVGVVHLILMLLKEVAKQVPTL